MDKTNQKAAEQTLLVTSKDKQIMKMTLPKDAKVYIEIKSDDGQNGIQIPIKPNDTVTSVGYLLVKEGIITQERLERAVANDETIGDMLNVEC